ncbi:ExeA family protein [Coralloluteibacterium stylophorae]|uniref:AAA family ATPase n=1 Tax=Coralloluteibacterium stylophorae TaxID=1776034 RepID=A0A8J7VTG6_9GAMM|nr:ExeA family protein [Coralloluteibacterium stylophorae]MBS7456798.1 AAA family ATPase [Coralloluteibacterium stylophorae]
MSDSGAYLRSLGLTRPPFPPTPDAACYFHAGGLERELAEATHCLEARKGFVLLTGEVGMGKSTFLRRLLQALEPSGTAACLVFNTFLQGGDLLNAILRDFGVRPVDDPATNIERFNAFLVKQWKAGVTCVLAIDDAQNLSLESLELLRLLSNMETGQEKLLQIVLAGQPELRDSLARAEIRQLTSRIVKHVRLDALDADDTLRYVDFRLAVAGGAGRIGLSRSGGRALYRRSGGNPRRIHLLMDRCLYGLVASGAREVDAALVRAAGREAGALEARTPAPLASRLRPVAAAAAVALLAAGGAFGLRATPAAPAATSPTATPPVQAPPALTAAAATPAPTPTPTPSSIDWAHCVSGLARTPDIEATALQLARAPSSAAAAFAGRSDVCFDPAHATVAWRTRLPLEQVAAGEGQGVRILQDALAGLGLDTGAVDGIVGPRTRQALARFQADNGLAATGRPDPMTLFLIESAAATRGATVAEIPDGNG